jgi:hypothetical protein
MSAPNPAGAVRAKQPELNLVPHSEHEDHDGDLGEHVHVRNHLCRKQMAGQVPREPPEQAGPEHDPRKYPSDNNGLPASPCQHAKQRGNHENCDNSIIAIQPSKSK